VSFSENGNLAEASVTRLVLGMAASTGTTTYDEVTFDADHKPVKGVARTIVRRADGTIRSQTNTRFLGPHGVATHTRRFKADGATISRDSIITKRADKTLSAADSIVYRFGVPFQGTLVGFEADGKTVTTIAKTDFSQATLLPDGTQIGGAVMTVVTRPDGTMSARSRTTLQEELYVTATENFAVDGKTITTVVTTASRKNGTLAVKRSFAFNPSGILQTGDRQSYDVDGLTLLQSTQTDFTGATLDPQGYILSGKVVARTLRPDTTIKSQTIIRYD